MLLPKLRLDQLISLTFAFLLLLIQGGLSLPEPAVADQQPQYLTLIDPAPVPVIPIPNNYFLAKELFIETSSETGATQELNQVFEPLTRISAEAYTVLDVNSAVVILEKNQQQPLYPASTVKLMSALVAKNSFPLNSTLLTGEEVFIAGNRIGLSLQKQVAVLDLIKATLVSSGNDAVQTLAYHFPLGYEGFVKAMNEEASRLSLKNTNFTNPTGFDDPNQLSTSFDLSRLARVIIKDPLLKNFINLPEAVISDTAGNTLYRLRNTNQLLTQFEQAKGVKTGTTQLAGQVLITYWQDEDYELIITVMNSKDRYQDTLALIDWVDRYVTWETF